MDEMASNAFRVSSFTAVGHLLHINLKEHLLTQKHEIGQALLKKCNRALAVVNKVNSIDNTFRNFEIEVIAKREDCNLSDEDLMIVEVNENKCRFKFDFSKVYWNSRLSTEHERIIANFNKSVDIVFDLFAGVGPFAVPAAKAKCKTYANDLNPESAKWLSFNMKYNKVLSEMSEVTNLDAKEYIQNHLKNKLIEEYKKMDDEELATKPKIHIIMNLPALASTFLPNFVGLFREEASSRYMINSKELLQLFRDQNLEHLVYCYFFLKGAFKDPKAEVRKLIENDMGRKLDDNQIIDIFRVRNVAPYKDMYRVEIKLDEAILFDSNELVGIMKGRDQNKVSINGTSVKKVTINAPNNKRSHDECIGSSTDDENEKDEMLKRQRLSSYCAVI